MHVWYVLDQGGSELHNDAQYVECQDDARIADLKPLVHDKNKITLACVDPGNLQVFEFGGTGDRCQGQTKLAACNSGSDAKPFRISYKGILVSNVQCLIFATNTQAWCPRNMHASWMGCEFC